MTQPKVRLPLLAIILVGGLYMTIHGTSQQATPANRPKVGVGVLVMRDAKILLGKRKNAHGAGTWALPGGHLEFGESFEDCAQRELLEETGLEAVSIRKYSCTNDIFVQENKHYVTVFMMVDNFIGEPQLMEPGKCECWAWFDVHELPENLFVSLKNLLQQEQMNAKNRGKNIFERGF